eukprot:320097-Pelagomonas_calceolata.AAC.2
MPPGYTSRAEVHSKEELMRVHCKQRKLAELMIEMVKSGGKYEPDASAAISGAGAEVGPGLIHPSIHSSIQSVSQSIILYTLVSLIKSSPDFLRCSQSLNTSSSPKYPEKLYYPNYSSHPYLCLIASSPVPTSSRSHSRLYLHHR